MLTVPIAYCAIDCRTVAQIQRSIVTLGKRNPISRTFHARNDKHTIAAWMSDLDRILQVFQVRSTVPSLPPLLTTHSQTELALHTHVAVSDVRHDVASTREIVSDIRRTLVKGQERTDSRDQTVSNHCVLSIVVDPYNFLDSGQVCDLNCANRSGPLHLNVAYLENHLPLRRGPVSDGMNWLRGSLVSPKASLQSPSSERVGLGKRPCP